MANISDYVGWRGDLTFKQSPFNDVDNLVLSVLAYADFKDIVPKSSTNETISLNEAAAQFFDLHDDEELMDGKLFAWEAPFLLKSAAASVRFKDIQLSKYIDTTDEENEMQFAAFHVKLGDGTTYIAFRGTDDSLIGWKEDFNMSFLSPVPSQLAAVEYVNNSVHSNVRKIRLGGHSKGGNLAIYAAVKCSDRVKKKIVDVYNNDGPGFDRQMVESEEYRQLLPKLKTIVPEHSVVGMLLEHEAEYMVVKSAQTGLLQHDAMSWQVFGAGFETINNISEASAMMKQALSRWINKIDRQQRQEFVELLFSVITSNGAKTLSELLTDGLGSPRNIFRQYASLDRDTKNMLKSVLRSLTGEFDKVIRQKSRK